MLSAAMMFAGCSKNEGGEDGQFTPPSQEQLTQSAYADNESTGGGFSFTADAPWTATVNEVQASAQAFALSPSATRTAGGDGNNVVWLKLYNGNSEAYSGGAGTITLRIEIDQNYTGERREATITIRSGNNTFTVTVVQEGTRQDGSENEPPVQVTKITLDKSELSLEAGDKATLTATVEPAAATIKSVVWSSSNPAVVTVNPVTGEMTAVADGTATVTATSSSNREVSASCTVTVGGDDPEPAQKLLRKIIVTSESKEEKSVTTSLLTYDDQNRISSTSIEDFDGPGTLTTSTYTYGSARIDVVCKYTNMLESGTINSIYKMDEGGYALSHHVEEDLVNVENIEYKYNEDGQLTKVVQDRENEITTTLLTWKNGNVVATNISDPRHYSESTVTYGTEKITKNADLMMGLVVPDVPGAYEDALPIYGKMSEYLPVEMKTYPWSDSEKPSEPNEITTYKYDIVDGYLMQAVITTTFPGSHVVTDTYVFEYE